MRRRDFIALLGGVFSWPFPAHAQQKAMPVIGWLSTGPPPANLGHPLRGPIYQGLSEEGFVEGQNMLWEYRWAEDNYDRLPGLATDLVSRKVDLIITIGGVPPALAAKNATATIPILFINVGDPVRAGLVVSLARPAGNLTGFSNMTNELTLKRLELLCELVPQATVIALLVNPDNQIGTEDQVRYAQAAAQAKGVRLAVLKANNESGIEAAFAQLRADALLVAADPFFFDQREQLVALASRYTAPAIYEDRRFPAAGGLISYAADVDALFRQAGIYAGKILKGAKTADLPVQQPTAFKLVVNLKTGQQLGLTVPPSILARADEVIE